MKNSYTSKEFKELLSSGKVVVGAKGRMVLNEEDTPEYGNSPVVHNDIFDFNPLDYIFIAGTVYSSKNSKQIFMKIVKAVSSGWRFKNKKTGVTHSVAPYITDSKQVKRYKTTKRAAFLDNMERFKEMCEGKKPPFFVELVFVMPDLRVWDFNNISQIIQDMAVDTGWIAGDDVRYMFTIPPLPPRISYYAMKDQPGVYIKVR